MSQSDQDQDHKLQGEGDYDAARRYRDKVREFVQRSDVDQLTQPQQPLSPQEARALAEERARVRSKGDDPADVGIMYPHDKPDSEH